MGWRAVQPPHIAAGLLLLLLINLPVTCHQDHQDAVHITAILGESVVFNCQVDFPEDIPVPYVLQWEKKVGETVRRPTLHSYNTTLLINRVCISVQ